MSNPYMREALVDEMEQSVSRPKPVGPKLPYSGSLTPPSVPAVTPAEMQRRHGQMASMVGGTMGGAAPTASSSGRSVERMAAAAPPADVGSGYEVPGQTETGTDPLETGGGGAQPPTNPWDNPNSSQYAPRIVERNGQTYLTEHGNERLLQPGEIAGGTQYRDDFWKQYPTGFQPGVGPQTNEAYAPPTQQGSSAALGASGATAGRYAGFDTQRAQDPSTSAKDAFLQAANASGSMPSTKEEAEAWFNQYVKQALIDAGYQVDWVDGDKAFVRTRENPGGEEIDFLQDAGGENPMLAWQSNMAGMTTGDGSGADTGGGGSASSAILGNENVMDDINAAIAKLMEQGMTLEDIQALIASGGMAGN